jgi:hypothetical protein
MLARQWSAAEAISIWSELVATRKAQLEIMLSSDQFHIGHLMASKIEVGLDKLAEWDSSTRAVSIFLIPVQIYTNHQPIQWIQAADKAFIVQQTQLMLIIDNVDRSLKSSDNLYSNILDVWRKNLIFTGKIATGMALSVEVLLGLSSWHLYPDMAVLAEETKHVGQKGSLIPTGAVVTVGLSGEKSRKATDLSWTIPLATLKYYGKPRPITSCSSLKSLLSPFERCVQVALGCIIHDWESNIELEDVLRLFIAISDRCVVELSNHKKVRNNPVPGWVDLFATQARRYFIAKEQGRRDFLRYVNLGCLRFPTFLNDTSSVPYAFGFSDFQTVFDLSGLSDETKLDYVRSLSAYHFPDLHLQEGLVVCR